MSKTIKVEEILNIANSIFLNSHDDHKIGRREQAQLLEQILHQTGNYNGFCYLSKQDMAASRCGHSVGVNEWDKQDQAWNFDNTDNTRVKYF